MLQNLEMEMKNKHRGDLLEYKIHLTKGWSLSEAKQIADNHVETHDLFTGLEQKTNYGRPHFDAFFKKLAASESEAGSLESASHAKRIGVFFCGPKQASRELHKISNKHSNDTVRFIYNKESF